MWLTYPDYCNAMDAIGHKPLSEEIWRRHYAPKPKDQEEQTPLFVASKKSKKIKPTLSNHISNAGKTVLIALERAYQMGREDTLKEIANV